MHYHREKVQLKEPRNNSMFIIMLETVSHRRSTNKGTTEFKKNLQWEEKTANTQQFFF